MDIFLNKKNSITQSQNVINVIYIHNIKVLIITETETNKHDL